MKKKSILIAGILFLSIIVFIGLGIMSDVNGSSGSSDPVTITVPQGSGTSSIAEILYENGIINNASYFKIYTKLNPVDGLQYGNFELKDAMSYKDIIKTLRQTSHFKETVTITIPEGFTLMQIAKRLENNGLCTADEFIEVANNEDFSQFSFWNEIAEHDHKFMKGEGYLYPDTYEFYTDETVYNIVAKFYENFDVKITDEMIERMHEIGMTLDEVITLASFVQEEAGHPEDQHYVAACLRNRLIPNYETTRLECNVSSYINEAGNYVYDYIVPYYGGVNSVPDGMMLAYDTYKNEGLPPSPIANPGIDAITNTLWPSEDFDGYYYFVTDKSGTYHYAKTYAEHYANIQIANEVNKGYK